MHTPVIHAGWIIAGILGGVLVIAPGLIWVERRLLALWQDRYGPNRAGPFGVLVVLADTLKLFFKEDWVPPFADRFVFVVAPAIVVITVLLSYVIVPISPGFVVWDVNIGILFFLAMSSMGA
jgi:NADH-quinone oxidoreductase subunit H